MIYTLHHNLLLQKDGFSEIVFAFEGVCIKDTVAVISAIHMKIMKRDPLKLTFIINGLSVIYH